MDSDGTLASFHVDPIKAFPYPGVRNLLNRIMDDPGVRIVVWNQDYHLMQITEVYSALLLSEGISDSDKKRIHVGQFMHTPFFDIHEIQGLIREDKRNAG